MKQRTFPISLTLILAAGAWIYCRQRVALNEARASLAAQTVPATTATGSVRPQSPVSPAPLKPSSQLIRLRAEVAALQREVDAPAPRQVAEQRTADEWALVHSGLKPSDHADFISFSGVTNVGFATPEAAFQSFHYAMRNQTKEPLTPTRMKDLYDVPDDFDDPNARYSIDLGMGIGRETGYRIVGQEPISTNEMRLNLDYEMPDGSSHRESKVLVERQGRWRLRLAGLTRQ